jgi:hypothetical protein
MPIIPTTTQEQIDNDLRLASILDTTEALNHAAAVFARRHALFYGRPLQTVLDDLNRNVADSLEMFADNTETGILINAKLDKVCAELTSLGGGYANEAARFSSRVPLAPGLPITYDPSTGLFVEIIPPTESSDP